MGAVACSGGGFGRLACDDDAVFCRLLEPADELSPLLLEALRPFWWVRRCCSMLSLRVKALLHSGQKASFFPVCFLACRAAWPEVVKKCEHLYSLASGQGYWFFLPVTFAGCCC
jgi:hypothetical protein